jgi:hypothetical protein
VTWPGTILPLARYTARRTPSWAPSTAVRLPRCSTRSTTLGIADDAIWVLTDDRRDDFELPVEGGGLRGTVQRAVHSLGYELDLLRALRDELQPGRVLVRVDDMGDAELRKKVAEAYWRHGGSHVSYLSRFTIEDMLPG